jgi:hypothetical protein
MDTPSRTYHVLGLENWIDEGWSGYDRTYHGVVKPPYKTIESVELGCDDFSLCTNRYLGAHGKASRLGTMLTRSVPPDASRTSPSVTCISKRRSGTEACCLIGMNFSFASNYAKVSKLAMSSAETACASAASRTTWLMTTSGKTKKS